VNAVRRNKRHGYRVAEVSLIVDDGGEVGGTLVERVRDAHRGAAAQRRQLHGALALEEDEDGDMDRLLYVGPDKRTVAPFGVFWASEDDDDDEDATDAFGISLWADEGEGPDGSGEEFEAVLVGRTWERPTTMGTVFFHCRDLGELDDEENGAELDALADTRRESLLGPGQTAGSRSLHEVVGSLWGVAGEGEAELQLLSFAAAATLSPEERVVAMQITDPSMRFELALQGLTEQQRLLATLLDGSDERPPNVPFGDR